MPTFEQNFEFDSSPFEQYVAENEPDILDYAVVPPYFEAAKKRALTPSTHLLFGARGGGKSATRLATERELWKLHAEGNRVPLAVPYVDFSRILERRSIDQVSSDDLLKELSFRVIETLLLWISDQTEAKEIVELLEPDELNLMVVLVQGFYLQVPEPNRRISQQQAMTILGQNWQNRTLNWMQRKWSAITEIVSEVASALLQKHADTESIKSQVADMFNESGAVISGTALLTKLVEVARIFGFTGVSVFVDKVDEHPLTQNSPEASARLIFPLLAHVQLMEVEGLGWQFFLWDRVKALLADGELAVRLDKLAHSEVSWTADFLRKMIDARISFFSSKRLSNFLELGNDEEETYQKIGELVELAVKSPRETIRLLDTVVREFDSKYALEQERRYLNAEDLENGMDKYVSDVIWSVYDKEVLSQILRLNKSTFINKEVQAAFKISAPSATNRIVKWQDAGAITQSGKREAEGGTGGKPSNEYSIADPRIMRLSERKLYDEKVLTEAPVETAE